MKLSLHKKTVVFLIMLLLITIIVLAVTLKWSETAGSTLPSWDMKWSHTSEDVLNFSERDWMQVSSNSKGRVAPKGTLAAWARISLPEIKDNSAVLIDKVYGHEIQAYANNSLIYSSKGKDHISGFKILIPLSRDHSNKQLYVRSSGGVDEQLGIEGSVITGSYSKLLALYVKQDIMDIFLGASFLFMAAVFAVCTIFLKRELFFSGFILALVILSTGGLMITSSPFLFLFIDSSRVLDAFFELSILILLLSSILFFERMFAGEKHQILVTKVRQGLKYYALVCLGLWILNQCLSYRLDVLAKYAENLTLLLMLLEFLFLLSLTVRYAVRGQVDAIILSGGFVVLAISSVTDLMKYYLSDGSYHLYWWKWGVVVLIISLILILGRGFLRGHEQVVQYSRELEQFNNDLQRSEKMEIISELAASVALEVQNPLLVTRGFLQILGQSSGQKEKEYFEMAVTELDRASMIITDFLTFAKPEIESMERIDVSGELRHVAGVLLPFANLRSSEIILNIKAGLYVEGNSSKLKQAFLNILKNSVEALHENGLVTITVWQSGTYIIVSVRDNGEGMKSSEIARLGEPYYSNKSKGTGLGLMVTFRIIEAMGGTIKFHSQPGEGTEVIVKLPVANLEEKEVLACV